MAQSPSWLLLILVAALAAAAIEDAVRLRISNIVCVVVALGAAAAMLISGPSVSLWQNFALFALILVAGTAAFSAGLMGGGDIKLLAATGLWLDLLGGLKLISLVLLSGGLVAIAYLAVRALRGGTGSARDRRVPYGLAITLGSLIAIASFRGPPGGAHVGKPTIKTAIGRLTII